jgi:hypothetical protein
LIKFLGFIITINISTILSQEGPGLCSPMPGRIDIFVKGSDNALWHMNTINNGNTWSSWESLGGVIVSQPTAVSSAYDRIDVFARGIDDALWHISYEDKWNNWENLGGKLTAAPAVTSWGYGRLDVIIRG